MAIKTKPAAVKDGEETTKAADIQQMKTLVIHGEKYKTFLTPKFENRKNWKHPDEKHVLSYIPGTVREIYLKEGAVVKKGDKLLLLEAMKMMNNISCPIDGKIKSINVQIDQSIPKGTLMVEFE